MRQNIRIVNLVIVFIFANMLFMFIIELVSELSKFMKNSLKGAVVKHFHVNDFLAVVGVECHGDFA